MWKEIQLQLLQEIEASEQQILNKKDLPAESVWFLLYLNNNSIAKKTSSQQEDAKLFWFPLQEQNSQPFYIHQEPAESWDNLFS